MWKVNRVVFITGLLGVTLTGVDASGSTKSDPGLPSRSRFELESQHRAAAVPGAGGAAPRPFRHREVNPVAPAAGGARLDIARSARVDTSTQAEMHEAMLFLPG